jgi:hypothetical protein
MEPMVTATPATPTPKDKERPYRPDPGSRGHIGWIVAGSLATGPVAAVLLVAAPFIPPTEAGVTGAVLGGLALGWAMLAVLSGRFTDQPQRWAAAPALFMGLSGLLLVAFGSSVHEVLTWVWPPALLALVIWMLLRARRQLRGPSRRWLVYPVLAVLALASVGGGYQTVREAADARAHPMPGQLIDVGGHRLHLSCTGSGSPTVVLEPGAGGMSSDLGWMTPAVARDTRVCVYDRAGRGWSEPADTPQDATQIATDLHTLLHRGHISGPYVLAGHSSAASTRSPSPPATPTRSPEWCWWTPPHRHRRRGRGQHRLVGGFLRPHGPCLRTGLDLSPPRSGPPGRRADRKPSPQHDRRVPLGELLRGGSSSSA